MKKLIPIVITLSIFAMILSRIDIVRLKDVLININLYYFSLALLLFIPNTLIPVGRWRAMIDKYCKITRKEGIKLFLGAGALNSITPSKAGDFARAYFLKKQDRLSLKRGIGSVLLEKYLDIASICFLSIVGLLTINKIDTMTIPIFLFSMGALLFGVLLYFFDITKILTKLFKNERLRILIDDFRDFLKDIKTNKRKLVYIIIVSIGGWVLQLAQVYFFFLSLNPKPIPPFTLILGLVPAAIIIGLIPITIGGMGTRDSALIILFSGYYAPELMLGFGLLFSLRYWIPSLVGLPFTKEYLSK